MVIPRVVLIGILVSVLVADWARGLPQEWYPGASASISLGPDNGTRSPGETVSSIKDGRSEPRFSTSTAVEQTTEPGISTGPSDNRLAYLDVTPMALRVSPGGSTLYFIQPIFWGEWGAIPPDFTVEMQLPSGMSLLAEPICGPRQPIMPPTSTCEIAVQQRSDGSAVLTARPSPSDGVYAIVGIGAEVQVGTFLYIRMAMRLEGDVPDASQEEISVTVLVVDPSDLSTSDESGVISGLFAIPRGILVGAGYARQGDTCQADSLSPGTELALYEWGGSDVVATATVSSGQVKTARDGWGGGETCVVPFSFEGIPERSVYMVATMPIGNDPPCRACVLGLLTPSERAEQVIRRESPPNVTSTLTPTPTLASDLPGTTVWGRLEVPTSYPYGSDCSSPTIAAGDEVWLTDMAGNELARSVLADGFVVGRVSGQTFTERAELVCMLSFHFEQVPAMDTYQLITPLGSRVIMMPPIAPYGIVVYVG